MKTVVKLFMVPFTSTPDRFAARTAWSATVSADIQAKSGSALVSMFAFCWNSVRVKPGHTHTMCTPLPATSTASASEKLSRNAFVAP